jgi:hypothetical protein
VPLKTGEEEKSSRSDDEQKKKKKEKKKKKKKKEEEERKKNKEIEAAAAAAAAEDTTSSEKKKKKNQKKKKKKEEERKKNKEIEAAAAAAAAAAEEDTTSSEIDVRVLPSRGPGQLGEFEVFKENSPFWTFIDLVCQDSKENWNSRQNQDTSQYFWRFGLDDYDAVESQRFYYKAHRSLNESCELGHRDLEHLKLFKDVPPRPGKGKGGGKCCMRDDASWHMKGLTAKYTLEFRRPVPELRNAKCLDRWSTVPLDLLLARLEENEGLKAKFKAVTTGDAFQVPDCHIKIEDEDKRLGVLRERVATSLFVSSGNAFAQLTGKRATRSTSPDGDRSSVCAMRRVVAVTFPHLCILFRDVFTAAQLEAAWLQMPLVRNKKDSRGTCAGKHMEGASLEERKRRAAEMCAAKRIRQQALDGAVDFR